MAKLLVSVVKAQHEQAWITTKKSRTAKRFKTESRAMSRVSKKSTLL